jgi:putative ATP-binding cassette transporter
MNCLTRLIEAANLVSDLAGYVARISELWMRLDAANEITNNSSIVTSNEAGAISFRSVTVKAAACKEKLLSDVSFTVELGNSLAIMGPSGSGKTGLIRAMYGLWPIASGEIITPSFETLIGRKRVMMIPQSLLFVSGSLKSQLLYPDDSCDMPEDEVASAASKLEKILELAGLKHLIMRFDGLDKTHDAAHWMNSLSPGEAQRLSFCRILYWEPDYASRIYLISP